MATTSSSSSLDKASSIQSTDMYYSNDDIGIVHNIVVLAQQLLPTLAEHERFPTTALFAAYYDILPRNGISTAGETKFSRILFKIGGLRGNGTLLEKFEEILARMGIDVEFTKETLSDAAEEDQDALQQQPLGDATIASEIFQSPGSQNRRNSESSKWDFNVRNESRNPTRRNSLSVEPLQQYKASDEPNLRLLETKASLLRQQNLLDLARRYCQQWKARALELREDNLGLELIAVHRDKGVLLRGALSDWLSKLHMLKSARESDQAVIALARRHLVRRRFFNYWKAYVLANKAKQATYLCKKYFAIWRQRILQKQEQEKAAEEFYKSKLLKRFFGSKTTNDGHAQTAIPSGLLLITQQERPYDRSVITRSSLFAAAQLWRQRTGEVIRAEQFDRTKVMRDAWITWQDTLRVNILQLMSNARILSDCLYKLVLAVRAIAFSRKVHERIKRDVFESWTHQTEVIRAKRLAQEATAQKHYGRIKKSAALKALVTKLQIQDQSKQFAIQIGTPRMLRDKFMFLKHEFQHTRELEQWASDARYFFVVSKCLNIWKTATENSRREKRKHAYVQVRRITKINLAKKALRTWRNRAVEASLLSEQASQVMHNRSVISGMDMLDRWRARSEEVLEMETSAVKLQRSKAVNVWRTQNSVVRKNAYEAAISLAQKREARAVKKWSLESLRVRGQHNYALDIHEKNSKRLFRRQFLQWQQRSKFRKEPGILDSSKSLRFSRTTMAGTRPFEATLSRRTYGGIDLSDIPEVSLSQTTQSVAHDFASTVSLRGEQPNRRPFEFHGHENVQEVDPAGGISTVPETEQQFPTSRTERTPFRNTSKSLLRTQPRSRPIGMSQSTSRVWAMRLHQQSTRDEDHDDIDDDDGKTESVEQWVQEVEAPLEFEISSGFLSTPSKRAVSDINSTTPAAPLATPIERRLRAQYSGGLLKSFQRSRFDATINKDTSPETMK